MKSDNQNGKNIFLISDGTGETVAQIAKAGLVQFGGQEAVFSRYNKVRSEVQIEAICEEAKKLDGLIIYTLVSPQLRSFLAKKMQQLGLTCIDVFGPVLRGLGSYFGYEPKAVAGIFHDVNERYFSRIEAMEFTVAHDDGRDFSELDKADLVILGISRTSKTPLSIYLSHQGWRVANIPLIFGMEPPKEILTVDPRRIIGLTIDPHELSKIRRARLERLGSQFGGDYADPEKVQAEVEFADEIFRRNRRWTVFNVTGKALEETATEIIRLMAARRLAPSTSLEYITTPKTT